MASLLDRYLEHLAYEKRASAHTTSAYKGDLALFEAYLKEQGVGELAGADNQLVRYWVMARMETGDSPRTVNRRLSAVRGFFRFARQVGAVDIDPTTLIDPPKTPKRLPEFVEEKRMELLFRSGEDAPGADAGDGLLVMELLYGTGMRLAELLALQIGDLDTRAGTLRLMGKRSKERIVPLAPGLITRLAARIAGRPAEQARPEAPLLIGARGEPLSRRSVQRLVQRYLGQVTTQEKRSPHVLRHTFATHMLNRGADLNAVKELLGHAGLAATQVYTHNTAEKLRSVHAQAHPRGGRRSR